MRACAGCPAPGPAPRSSPSCRKRSRTNFSARAISAELGVGAAARATEVDSAIRALDFETSRRGQWYRGTQNCRRLAGDVAGCSQRTGLTYVQLIARRGANCRGSCLPSATISRDDRDRPRPPARDTCHPRPRCPADRRADPARILLVLGLLGRPVDARAGAHATGGLARAAGRAACPGRPDPARRRLPRWEPASPRCTDIHW